MEKEKGWSPLPIVWTVVGRRRRTEGGGGGGDRLGIQKTIGKIGDFFFLGIFGISLAKIIKWIKELFIIDLVSDVLVQIFVQPCINGISDGFG